MTTRWSAFSPLIIKEYNSHFKVLLKCEQLEYYYPSIVPEVYNINPPLENIEEKLEQLCYKTEEILEAVQDCSEYEDEQGKKVDDVGREKIHDKRTPISMFECSSDPDSWRIFSGALQPQDWLLLLHHSTPRLPLRSCRQWTQCLRRR